MKRFGDDGPGDLPSTPPPEGPGPGALPNTPAPEPNPYDDWDPRD